MGDILGVVIGKCRWLWRQLIGPLQENEDMEGFTLAIPEVHTTTLEGDTGWNSRPPATLSCPQCGSEIYQHRPGDAIDCPRCTAAFDRDEFPDLELLYMECPKCRSRMEHGRRHPQQVEVPEWATCENCRYHWEFEHWY
ncbi:MAG: hypothetical protein V5A46_07760 [Haloferacaceae archaeon]